MISDQTMMENALPPLETIPADIRSLADYERRAAQHIPASIFQHVQEGSGREITLRENREAFDRIGLLPRAFAELEGDTNVTLFSRKHTAPVMLAPLAYQRLVHPEGELATVRAAVALDIGMIVSTLSSVPLEEIARAAQDLCRELGKSIPPLWFQLYLQPSREDSLSLVHRAEQAGYEAVVLTIDAALKPAGITLPNGVEAVNLVGMARPQHTATSTGSILLGTPLSQAAPKWADLEWLRAQTQLPILVKGMVLGEDAVKIVDAGVDGLILSNHGGRVLDGIPSPLDLIQSVNEAIQGRIPILLDGGIRMGTDVLKSLALGAKSVLIGRPQMHALAVAGMPGLAHALLMLRTELEAAMGQMGCPTLASLTPDRLVSIQA